MLLCCIFALSALLCCRLHLVTWWCHTTWVVSHRCHCFITVNVRLYIRFSVLEFVVLVKNIQRQAKLVNDDVLSLSGRNMKSWSDMWLSPFHYVELCRASSMFPMKLHTNTDVGLGLYCELCSLESWADNLSAALHKSTTSQLGLWLLPHVSTSLTITINIIAAGATIYLRRNIANILWPFCERLWFEPNLKTRRGRCTFGDINKTLLLPYWQSVGW